MKKTVLYILLALLCIGTLAQSVITRSKLPEGKSWEDKHFKEALMKGRDYKEYYVLVNEDKKIIKLEDLTNYCRAHNYLWKKKYETKEIPKFGDVATSIYKFYFLPEEEYIYYVFDWTDRTMSNSGDLRSKGSVYFFVPESNSFLCIRNEALWSGTVSNGYIEGTGAGLWKKDSKTYYYFSGSFKNGFPMGKAKYRIVVTEEQIAWGYSPRETMPGGKAGTGPAFREVEVGEMSDGMALFRYLDDGEKRNNGSELYGYVNQNGSVVIKPTYKTAYAFNSGRAAVVNDKGEDIYIDKTGKFVDYTEKQKQIFAEAKAKEDAEKAEQERQRLLAEQKAAEEKRIAEAKEADLKRRIEVNKNPKLWSRGCRLAYRFANGYEYVLATLEEWNEDRSKVKIKIIASPSAQRSLNGDMLEKNNTMWVSARNEGWHLALDEEITAALNNDNSVRRETVVTTSSSSGSNYSTCSSCRGSGMRECYNCSGKGYVEATWSDERSVCDVCGGRGRAVCYSCNGTGKKR